MMISGANTQCISESLNAADLFTLAELPKAERILPLYDKNVALEQLSLLPFLQFLKGCRMTYDYTHQHIIVYNPIVNYAYVYSLKSKYWGMIHSELTDNVNSYPEALVMDRNNNLLNLSESKVGSTPILIVTRPLTMENQDVFKTVNTIIQRGLFKKHHIMQVLYGSNDLYNWHVVWSSKDSYMRGISGTPYKAFRLLLIGSLSASESITGCSVEYSERMKNQLR